MDECTVEDSIVTTFINAAEELITKVFAGNTAMTATLLIEIERWFVAHMIASTVDRTTSKEKLGDADVTYTGEWGKALESTPYGQMVMQLDYTGLMSAVGKKGAYLRAVKSIYHNWSHERY
jgi:hypothetical protein